MSKDLKHEIIKRKSAETESNQYLKMLEQNKSSKNHQILTQLNSLIRQVEQKFFDFKKKILKKNFFFKKKKKKKNFKKKIYRSLIKLNNHFQA